MNTQKEKLFENQITECEKDLSGINGSGELLIWNGGEEMNNCFDLSRETCWRQFD
jgi:hypothetical protein